MSQITTLLVGDHFRPPAKLILQHLPSGCQLQLMAEDDNAYDEEAVKVLVGTDQIPEEQYSALAEALPGMGFELEQVMSTGPVWLGYVPKSGGKPLLTAQKEAPELVGNHEVREAMAAESYRAQLAFGPDGRARVTVQYNSEDSTLNGLKKDSPYDQTY